MLTFTDGHILANPLLTSAAAASTSGATANAMDMATAMAALQTRTLPAALPPPVSTSTYVHSLLLH